MSGIIGIFQEFPQPPEGAAKGVKTAYQRVRFNKANPRNQAYMESLFKDVFPGGEFIAANENDDWQEKAKTADKIILLYPDSTGLEFSEVEKWSVENGKRVLALNGRRRLFTLDGPVRLKLAIRRIMENFMIGEIIFAGIFAVLTPIFLFVDWARGRI